MEQPPCFVAQDEFFGLVCQLQKPLQGLKQPSKAWFNRFNIMIQQFAMTKNEVDHSVFNHSCIYLVVYVDHLGITKVEKHLFKPFPNERS